MNGKDRASIIIRSNLAHLLWIEAKYTEAEALCRAQLAIKHEQVFKSLAAIHARTLGPEAPGTLDDRLGVGEMLRHQGRNADTSGPLIGT